MKDRDGNEWVLVPCEATEEMLIAGLNDCDPIGSLIDWDDSKGECITRKTVADGYKAAIAAAPQFVAGEVTEEMCQRVAASFYGADTFANGVEMHEALQLWRKELGPALGLVEIREPSDDECIAINEHVLRAHGIEGCGAVLNGRVIFDAVAKWLKGEL